VPSSKDAGAAAAVPSSKDAGVVAAVPSSKDADAAAAVPPSKDAGVAAAAPSSKDTDESRVRAAIPLHRCVRQGMVGGFLTTPLLPHKRVSKKFMARRVDGPKSRLVGHEPNVGLDFRNTKNGFGSCAPPVCMQCQGSARP
jgi:hypothetical protein